MELKQAVEICFLRPDPPVARRSVRKALDAADVDRACVDSEGCAQSVREVLVEEEALRRVCWFEDAGSGWPVQG